MRRTERLFQIIQILRASRVPITGRKLADELEISLRSLYRDTAELIAQGIPITGEAGTGYVLDDGYDMPPLMLTPDELEAAALGAALVTTYADASLARGARDLFAKISAVVPKELQPIILDAGVHAVSARSGIRERFDGADLRLAIRERFKLGLNYTDSKEVTSYRVIWPLFVAYFDQVRLIVAWCESRHDFRHFRTDRVKSLERLDEKYPAQRQLLIRNWTALRNATGDGQ